MLRETQCFVEDIIEKMDTGRSAGNNQIDRNAQFRSTELRDAVLAQYATPSSFFGAVAPIMTMPAMY